MCFFTNQIAPLVEQCRKCKSPAVVTQLCKTMAALACRPENRQRVAGEGGTAAICEVMRGGGCICENAIYVCASLFTCVIYKN
jgi:hypothetical protein